MSETGPDTRRPIGARSTRWAQTLAARLAQANISPNQISAASVGFAVVAGLALWGAGGQESWFARTLLILLAAAGIGARLLANMLDGMVAVEHGSATPDGGLWNEVPDRIADVVILLGAGAGLAAAGDPWGNGLGVLAALGALMTAYVREIGARLGAPMDFGGLMAKPHRMAALLVACAVWVLESMLHDGALALWVTLWIICLGTAETVVQRLGRTRAFLLARATEAELSASRAEPPRQDPLP